MKKLFKIAHIKEETNLLRNGDKHVLQETPNRNFNEKTETETDVNLEIEKPKNR